MTKVVLTPAVPAYTREILVTPAVPAVYRTEVISPEEPGSVTITIDIETAAKLRALCGACNGSVFSALYSNLYIPGIPKLSLRSKEAIPGKANSHSPTIDLYASLEFVPGR